jgi:hypothetical protein
MDMNREKWINEVMDSLDDVKSAEAGPFLYNRILNKLEKGEKAYAPARLVWLAAASLALLVLLNVFILRTRSMETRQRAETEQLANAYQLMNTSTINYN